MCKKKLEISSGPVCQKNFNARHKRTKFVKFNDIFSNCIIFLLGGNIETTIKGQHNKICFFSFTNMLIKNVLLPVYMLTTFSSSSLILPGNNF